MEILRNKVKDKVGAIVDSVLDDDDDCYRRLADDNADDDRDEISYDHDRFRRHRQ